MTSLGELALRRRAVLPASADLALPHSALDNSLHTTHGPTRIFLIVAHYCNLSIYLADRATLSHTYRTSGFSFSLLRQSMSSWWRFEVWSWSLGAAEAWEDVKARVAKGRLWARGVRTKGWAKAWEVQAGLLQL